MLVADRLDAAAEGRAWSTGRTLLGLLKDTEFRPASMVLDALRPCAWRPGSDIGTECAGTLQFLWATRPPAPRFQTLAASDGSSEGPGVGCRDPKLSGHGRNHGALAPLIADRLCQ